MASRTGRRAVITAAQFLRGRLPFWLARLPPPVQRNLLRTVPGSSSRWGPPRRWAAAAEVARQAGGEWREVFAAAPEMPFRSVLLPEDRRHLARLRPGHWDAAGVAVIPQGRVVSAHGFAVGPNDTLVVDAAFCRHRPAAACWSLPRIRETLHLAGPVLNLGSTWAFTNFAHQLLDVWPRWELVRLAGWHWHDFAQILAPWPNFAVVDALITQLGVPRDRLRQVRQGQQVICETLVQPTHPSGATAGHYPPWVVEFFRRTTWPSDAAAPPRLYVARRARLRRLENEAELIAALTDDGFVAVDAAELNARAPGWFATAEEIVAPHGAALAHAVFSCPGTRLVEIFPRDYVIAFYASLAHAAGLAYGAVVGDAQHGPRAQRTFRVDVAKVRRVLQELRAR